MPVSVSPTVSQVSGAPLTPLHPVSPPLLGPGHFGGLPSAVPPRDVFASVPMLHNSEVSFDPSFQNTVPVSLLMMLWEGPALTSFSSLDVFQVADISLCVPCPIWKISVACCSPRLDHAFLCPRVSCGLWEPGVSTGRLRNQRPPLLPPLLPRVRCCLSHCRYLSGDLDFRGVCALPRACPPGSLRVGWWSAGGRTAISLRFPGFLPRLVLWSLLAALDPLNPLSSSSCIYRFI